jgi:amino acid permease
MAAVSVRSGICVRGNRGGDDFEMISGHQLRAKMLRTHCRAMMLAIALFSPSASAYIDPNTGGFLFQLLAPLFAIALAIWMFLGNQARAMWRSLRNVFSRKIDRDT